MGILYVSYSIKVKFFIAYEDKKNPDFHRGFECLFHFWLDVKLVEWRGR